MNQATRDFICLHADDDVQQLALSAPRKAGGVDMAFALRQIAGRQVARRKLPSWAAVEGLVYPPHISMEQCSSEQTARYKATLVRRLLADNARQTVVDLTGGLGVDFSFLAPMFRRAVYVERQEHLCEAARENFRLLGLPQAEVVCGDGTDYLRQMLPVSLIYIDPARRDANGQRTFGIADCTPDVTQICDEMVQKSEYVFIKLSPMLDWHEACASLMHGTQCVVREVHIVSVGNECKELLLVTENGELRTESEELRMVCVNILADEAEERFELNVPSSQAQTSPLSVLNSQLSTLNSQFSVLSYHLSVCTSPMPVL